MLRKLYELVTGKCWHQWYYEYRQHSVDAPVRAGPLMVRVLYRACNKCGTLQRRTKMPIGHGPGWYHNPNIWVDHEL